MPKEVINVDGKHSAEQDKLKNTVWEMFHELLKNFKDRVENDPTAEKTVEEKVAAEGLISNLEKLLKQMSSEYQRRNQMGNYLPMRKGTYKELKDSFKTCLKAARGLSGPLAQSEEARALRSALAKGRNAMTALDKSNLPSLAQALSGLTHSTIRLVNTDIRKMEGGMNSRMAVKYTDELGIVHEGFLTKEEKARSLPDELKTAAEEVAKKYPQYADAIRASVADKNFLDALRTQNPRIWNRYYNSGNHPWLNQLEGPQKKEIFKDLAEKVYLALNKNAMLKGAGIRPGSKLARRNGAMSDVARLLGFPQLLAESRRVTIEQNGEKIDGVMMEAADMEALDNVYMNPDSPFFKVNEDQFNSEPLLRSLADLQILDFLCGNIDRHKANFFTRFDLSDPAHPKITGVQGIDNDTSFGEITQGGIASLAKADNLKIITPEMADAVTKMDKEDLDEILRDYGLSETEIEAANSRLDTLKGYIFRGARRGSNKLQYRDMGGDKPYTYIDNYKNTIHIVEADEWKKLTIKGLATIGVQKDGDGRGNIFNEMEKQLKTKRDLEEKNQFTRERKMQYAEQDVSGALGRIRESLEGEYEKVRKMKELLAGKCKEDKGGHQEFTDLAVAVNFLNEKYEKVLKDTAHVRTMDDATIEKLDAFYKTLSDQREELLRRASAYENSHTGLRFSPMGRGRKELAESLRKFVAPKKKMSQKLYDQNKVEIKEGLSALQGKTIIDEETKKPVKGGLGKDAYESAPAAANQLGGLMESTMRRNVEKHSRSGETYDLGVKALAAQKRLWNYSQSHEVKILDSENKESAMNEEGNERIAMSIDELIEYEPQNRKDVSEDVKAIMDFVGKQSSSAKKDILSRMKNGDVQSLSSSADKKSIEKEQTFIGKNEMRINPKFMTPKEALSFLGMVFEQEAKIANPGKAKGKPAPAKQKGKG